MKIITISREFGSGGRELGRLLAKELSFDYYDKKIIATIASNKGLDENYVARTMEQHKWQNVSFTYYPTAVTPTVSTNTDYTDLLLERKRVIEKIAKSGKDCVIVGRNADVLLREYKPFNIFVCAKLEAKIKRCQTRAPEDEKLSSKEIEQKINRIEKSRAKTRCLISDSSWGDSSSYHITVNTTFWNLEELAVALAQFIREWYNKKRN